MEQSGETWIAEVLMEWRHGARFDSAPEPVAQHDVIAVAQFIHESWHIAEVVTVVRIPHDDKRAASPGNARAQCGAVSALRHANHARPALFRNLNRAVRRTVVRHNYFPA